MSSECIILIVDDEPIGRSALLGLLSQEGYRLEVAPDGPTALRIASEITPDVVLLDVMMPGMDGYEVTRQIRATPALAEMPILLVTALDGAESRLAGIEAGADDFINKPFDRVELRARVRAITRLNRFRRLGREREKYRLLFESAPCGLLVIDKDMSVREANPLAVRLLDQALPGDEARSLLRLVPPEEVNDVRELLDAVSADPSAAPRYELTTTAADGRPLWLELTVTLFGPQEEGAYQVALRDMTAQRTAEANLLHAQKLDSLGQLAGGIAHDFNNLLTAINGFSAMALDELPVDSPIRELVESVCQAGEKATALTRQLLNFTRRQPTSPTTLDLNSVVSGLKKMLTSITGRNIILQCELAEPLWRVKADPGQIEQILVNLVINARDAMPGGGVLTIKTTNVKPARTPDSRPPGEPERGSVRLLVKDTGTGMTPEVRARIFEPFFTTKEPGRGTGLGLATVYGIVMQHNGQIDVISKPGSGSIFVIDLPSVDEPVESSKPDETAEPLPRGRETILLAEDEDGVRSFTRLALESAGYTVLAASDGMEALQMDRNRTGPIDLLMTDLLMPRLSGQWLLKSFRASRPEAKVLLASACSDDDTLRRHGKADNDAFLAKPYSHASLLRKVRDVLDGHC